eukprot:CAMPEP_0178398590 /NCGR_PEP_ID=MMETSP0689_2-20121128/14851_1 /TAXON_ID=160604 /ORGANISM="Amphidinium massartii, Strain CS-259" /LENGTH=539 /DNA_ID=CAMNT_0020019357 /DNA_START=101 /DNA_END=1720 /DNA_ORIENTATION=+
MVMKVLASALLFLAGSSRAAAGALCSSEGCAEQSSALLQQKQKEAVELLLHPRGKKNKKKAPHHAGTVNLLLAEMNDMIQTKGQLGMDPDEIEHIHSIKALIDDTILPTILESVEEHKKELDELYADILTCEGHAVGVVNATQIREEVVDKKNDDTRNCEVKEDIIKHKMKQTCETLNRTRISIYIPADEDFPAPNVPDEELIKYLDFMDEFYCGTYETFYEEWQECEDDMENYTVTHQECIYLAKEFAEVSCTWKTHLEKTCEYFDTCWTEAVKRYNQRVKEILELQKSTVEEYEGASNIQCLWSAWIYEYMPCTVNKTRVRECHEYPPNVSNVTISFPPPPPPPTCSTASVTLDICTDEWLNINYGDLGISKDILDELRANCIPCESYTWTSAPVVLKHVHVYNAREIGGNGYFKTDGTSGMCDSFVETDDPNVYGVKFHIEDRMSRYKVEIVFNSSSIGMELSGGNCAVMEGDDVAVYHEGDMLSMTISAGQVIFMENSEQFSSFTLPDDSLTMGFGKMTMCGSLGSTGTVEFLTA